MPFILMDDGSYDLHLQSIPPRMSGHGCAVAEHHGAPTPTTFSSGRVFSASGGTARRSGRPTVTTCWPFTGAAPVGRRVPRVSAASWNRGIAALDKLYRWAVEEGIITTSPFSYGVTLRRAAGTRAVLAVTTNRARERAARQHDMRYVDLGRYLLFRDVGLRGRSPDGTDDPTWRGRNGERNALFAELLVTTGLRLTEGGSLLLADLPRATEAGLRSVVFDLPGAVAKGGRPRRVRIPRRVLALINDYIDLERTISSARWGSHRSPIHSGWRRRAGGSSTRRASGSGSIG